MAMDFILATIADGKWAVVDINREGISAEVPGGGVCPSIKTMPLEKQMAPSWQGCLCAVCFASKKPFAWEF